VIYLIKFHLFTSKVKFIFSRFSQKIAPNKPVLIQTRTALRIVLLEWRPSASSFHPSLNEIGLERILGET